MFELPPPSFSGEKSVEEVIRDRKSIRKYSEGELELSKVSQLLWAASMVPSAGAIYPMVVYLVAEKVEGLEAGIYKYHPSLHSLEKTVEGKRGSELGKACLGQACVTGAPANIAISAIYKKIKAGYGERGVRYAMIEAGHISQNVYLQAEALELGTVAIGAFFDEHVTEVLKLPPEENPLYIMPVGQI